MKRIFMSIIILCFGVLISGCASVSYDIKINDDLSANVALKILMDTTFVDMHDTKVKDELNKIQEEAIKNGYTVTPLKEGNNAGIVASKFVENINDVSLSDVLGKEDAGDKLIFHIHHGIIYDTYIMNIPYEGLIGKESSNVTKGVLSQMKVKFSLEAPTEIKGANGKHVLNWEFDSDSKNTVEASFKKVNENRLFIYSVIILIGLGTWNLVRRRRKRIKLYMPTYK